MSYHFPDDFLFGVSTSAYQIEGGVEADGRGTSIWDTFSHTSGKTRNGETGDIACDHYRRYREDIALMETAGLDAYRFSIAWPRVMPRGGGPVNPRGLDFYDRLCDLLLERGIEPWVCLYHWDLPQVLQERGGWTNRDLVGRFADYAVAVTGRLGDRAAGIALLNEPSIVAIMGYLLGRHAPGIADLEQSLAATHHLNLATAVAAEALRSERRGLRLGTILALNDVEPASDRDGDVAAVERIEALWNTAYLDPLLRGAYPEALEDSLKPFVEEGDLERCRTELDFLGVNYYTRLRAKSGGPMLDAYLARPEPGSDRTAMGWEICPEGLYRQLLRLKADYGDLALYLTETGAAFDDAVAPDGSIDDRERIDFLRRHLAACAGALAAGVDLRGVFVWSLLDNFEWNEGYEKRFGLVRVDYQTLERTPKASYEWYRRLISSRELEEE